MAKIIKNSSDTPYRNDAERIILTEIDRIPGEKKYSGDNIFIVCPFHADTDPSASVYIGHDKTRAPLGFMYCHGCGKKAHWNQLADKLGLTRIADHQFQDIYVTPSTHPDLLAEELTLSQYLRREYPKNMIVEYSATAEWRGTSGKLLRRIGCMSMYDAKRINTFIVLPIYVQGRLVGSITARKKRIPGQPSYFNSTGPVPNWSKRYGLFPYDYALRVASKYKRKPLILVEGPRDALRLLSYRIPAVAMLGVSSWSNTKRDLLLAATSQIILMMDGDLAGQAATERLGEDLSRFIEPDVYDLSITAEEEGRKIDPGNMPESIIEDLLRHLKPR